MAAEFDELFEDIVTILEAYSTAQIAANQFGVYPDFMRMIPNDSEIAKVFVYMGGWTPREQAGNTHFEYRQTYNIDMIAKGKGDNSGASYENASRAAGKRLRFLIEQVRAALFTSANWKLNQSAGGIGMKPMMRLDTLDPSDPRMTERVLAAARFTLEVDLVWEPTLQTGTAIDGILVKQDETAPLWSALIEP